MWEYRARLIDEMIAFADPPPPAPMQRVEPTGWLGTPHFEPALMTAPMRWW
jgi:hypothetical protein